jgi:hydroxypyruvate reductase
MTATAASSKGAFTDMGQQWIKNLAQIDAGRPRKTALSLVNAALNAIDTGRVFASSVSLQGDVLRIKDHTLDLARFQTLRLIGIGKAAHAGAVALERILGSRLTGGLILGPGARTHGSRFSFHRDTHPMPSASF